MRLFNLSLAIDWCKNTDISDSVCSMLPEADRVKHCDSLFRYLFKVHRKSCKLCDVCIICE